MVANLKLRPLHDRLIVERIEEDSISPGGIYIPDNAKEKPARGTVLAVGAGKTSDAGHYHKMDVKVGDKVLFGKYAGSEVKLDGKEYLIMREDDVMAIIEA